MLRRTKDQLIDGKPIIQLPPRIVTVCECEFDSDERAFYNMVEGRMNKVVDKMMNEVKKGSGMINMLILLLRMRQGMPRCLARCSGIFGASALIAI